MELTKKVRLVIDAMLECDASMSLAKAMILVKDLADDVEFVERYSIALEKGWRVPSGGVGSLPKHSWNYYWMQCQIHEDVPTTERPIVPHRC